MQHWAKITLQKYFDRSVDRSDGTKKVLKSFVHGNAAKKLYVLKEKRNLCRKKENKSLLRMKVNENHRKIR